MLPADTTFQVFIELVCCAERLGGVLRRRRQKTQSNPMSPFTGCSLTARHCCSIYRAICSSVHDGMLSQAKPVCGWYARCVPPSPLPFLPCLTFNIMGVVVGIKHRPIDRVDSGHSFCQLLHVGFAKLNAVRLKQACNHWRTVCWVHPCSESSSSLDMM